MGESEIKKKTGIIERVKDYHKKLVYKKKSEI